MRTAATGQRLSLIRFAFLATALLMISSALYFSVRQHRATQNMDQLIVQVTLLLVHLCAIAAVALSRGLRSYYVGLFAQLLTVPALGRAFSQFPTIYVPAILFVIVEVAFFEPFPRSIVFTVTAALLSYGISLVPYFQSGAPGLPLIVHSTTFLPIVLFSVFCPFVTNYRERLVTVHRESEHLRESVVRLTRANTRFQEFALSASEQERLRITREIHDVVGYSLTNNIMLLEAAMRIMQENVLALPSLIEMARKNAQDALEQVRSALYKLRLTGSDYPSGVKAISQLVKIFEQATQVSVRCEFGNLPWTISDRIDSILYHLVQESLVNAFRHGKATEVEVLFWMNERSVRVSISDNGAGATGLNEGIGLSGMRERLSEIGGALAIRFGPGIFEITAELPTGEEKNGREDTHRHCR